MKIAINHHTFTNQSYGGISRYYTSLANEFSKQGEAVKVFAGVHRNNYLNELPRDVVNGKNIYKYPPRLGRAFQWINYGVTELQMKLWQPDIIHETYYSSMPHLNRNTTLITSVYDMIHELFSEQFPARDKTTQRKRRTFDRVDHLICISNSTKCDLINHFGIDDSKISVVHLGVDLENFQKPKLKSKFNGCPYILYVGSRAKYKNFERFLSACANSELVKNNIKIVCYGGGGFSKKERVLIHGLGFKGDFVYQLDGSDEVLATLYSHSLCLVYPSLYEGFGLPPLEAMAAGCPVVSSNTSSMPEVINKAGIYFDPYNTEEIQYAIDTVVSNEALRSELIKLGFENIKSFSWRKCAAETLDVYKGLVG